MNNNQNSISITHRPLIHHYIRGGQVLISILVKSLVTTLVLFALGLVFVVIFGEYTGQRDILKAVFGFAVCWCFLFLYFLVRQLAIKSVDFLADEVRFNYLSYGSTILEKRFVGVDIERLCQDCARVSFVSLPRKRKIAWITTKRDSDTLSSSLQELGYQVGAAPQTSSSNETESR